MSRLVLWGRANSANVQKALFALAELGLEFDHRLVGGAHGGLDAPAYRALNPNGRVPTFQDGELVVWESHAIVRYLAATYGHDSLWRTDPRQRAITDQWTDWTATTFQPAWLGLFWLAVRTPPAAQDAAAIASARQQTSAALLVLDRYLTKNDYLGGSRISYADICAGVALHRLAGMEGEGLPCRAVSAWHARLAERPAFRKHVAVPYDELVGRLAY